MKFGRIVRSLDKLVGGRGVQVVAVEAVLITSILVFYGYVFSCTLRKLSIYLNKSHGTWSFFTNLIYSGKEWIITNLDLHNLSFGGALPKYIFSTLSQNKPNLYHSRWKLFLGRIIGNDWTQLSNSMKPSDLVLAI